MWAMALGKRLWAVFLVAGLMSTAAESGQSLAELAKKERERRASAGKNAPPTAVISNKELSEARGDSVSITGAERAETPEEPEEESGPPPEVASRLTAKEIADLRQQWTRIWQEQLTQAEQELEKAKDDVYQCRSADKYFFVPIAVDCEGVDLRLAAAESRLRTVKRNRFHWELLLPENTTR
jgi:hypothetical protein